MSLVLKTYLAAADRCGGIMRRRLEATGLERWREMAGEPGLPRPAGPLVWFHAASENVALSILELIRRMSEERDELCFLVTTPHTVDAERLVPQLPPAAIHQFAPADIPKFSKAFHDYWHPDIGIWTEDELRPSLIAESAKRCVPLYLIDARVPTRNSQIWQSVPGLKREISTQFEGILASDPIEARSFALLGVNNDLVESVGVLEEGTAALPCNEEERSSMADALKTRPVWFAASLSREEETIATEAQRSASRAAHRLLLVLAPDEPARGAELAQNLRSQGFRVAVRSQGEIPAEDTQILVADIGGETGLWYRLAPVTFLGNSIGNTTGLNPFEPAALGSAILHGPGIEAHRENFNRLSKAGASRLVRDSDELSLNLRDLLSPEKAAEMAHNAWMVCSSGAEVTDRVIDLIFTRLDAQERT